VIHREFDELFHSAPLVQLIVLQGAEFIPARRNG
jgi:hypothetical protein